LISGLLIGVKIASGDCLRNKKKLTMNNKSNKKLTREYSQIIYLIKFLKIVTNHGHKFLLKI